MKLLSRVRLFATPWTVAYEAPLSVGFSRQECWSGLPFSSPGDLPNPEIEPGSPALQADSLPTELQGKPSQHWIKTFLASQKVPTQLPQPMVTFILIFNSMGLFCLFLKAIEF